MNVGSGSGFRAVGVAVLLATIGCSQAEVTSDAPGTQTQALTPVAARTFGFESLEDWSPLYSSPQLSLSPIHSEGQSSLAFGGGGWMKVQSRPLSKEAPAPQVVGYDVRVPNAPVNPWWYGNTELSIDAPSAGIYDQYVGNAELTGFPKGQFKRVELEVPKKLLAKLNNNYGDLRLRIVVNVSRDETAPYLVDHFTFGPATPTCTPQSDGNPCTDDVCVNGSPAWTPRAAGSACDTDATVCNGAGTCDATGACILGPAPTIDDQNPCTTDACDPVTGVVHLPVAAGVSCDADANVCNGVSRCDGAGVCAPGTAPVLDDANPCTVDSCDALTGVRHLAIADGTNCDSDNDVCNGVSTCRAGTCAAGTPLVLDDGNICTADSCDPVNGVKHVAVPNGSSCDDGSACTLGDTCQSGVCAGGAAKLCAAIDQCHDNGVCDPSNGACSAPAKPDGAACNDGNGCTRTDACLSGTCLGTNPVICAAKDACHAAGSCDASTGACSNPSQPDGTACDDATVCNGHETCAAGTCTASTAPSVDDGNPCTSDSCDPVKGAQHVAIADGTSCDADHDVCNGISTCSAGACVAGAPPTLNDGNVCTADSCDPVKGVLHAPVANGTACDDGNACTQADKCQAGSCVPGAPKACIASDQCHDTGVCDPTSGACSTPAKADGAACNDSNGCTQTDTCVAGSCVGSNPVTCVAQDTCHAVGSCNPATGTCSNPSQPDGTACDDTTVCNGHETCAAGACKTAAALSLDDGNPCTADSCDPIAGVQHVSVADGTNCDSDHDVCNGVSTCSAGTCVAGTTPSLDDGNACTADSCDPTKGVQHNAVANGTACDDGNACTQSDKCQAGSCVAGAPKVCAAVDQCHDSGACDPASGACTTPAKPDGATCNDGNACTQTDTCVSGACAGSNPVTCAAQDACHAPGSCDAATGSCSNPTQPDGTACDDATVCNGHETCAAGTCTASAALSVDDGNPCTADSCDPVSGARHVAVADGTSCESDGNVCNGVSTCSSGACMAGTPPVLNDNNPCTADSCDPTTGVEHTPVAAGVSCSDADVCNGDERCDNVGTCADGTPLAVDDGDACTLDDCDPATGVSHTEIPDCRSTAASPGRAFETRASILGRVVRPDGSPVTAFHVDVFDDRMDHDPRADVLTEATADGSFRARLSDFPESAPDRTPPSHVILSVTGPEFPNISRSLYLRPGDAASVGDLVILPRDPKITVVGPAGGTAQDSSGAFELQIPAGALPGPVPIQITPIPERRLFPTPLPGNTITMYGVELEPTGTVFALPAKLRIRNSLNLPTTMTIPLGTVDSTFGDWQQAGFATWDGTRFVANIQHFSKYDVNGGREGELVYFHEDGADPNKNRMKTCVGSSAGNTGGGLSESISLPGYSGGGLSHGVTLNFNGGLSGSVTYGAPVGVPSPPGIHAPLVTTFATPRGHFECAARGSAPGTGGCGTGLPCTGVTGGVALVTPASHRVTVFGKQGDSNITLPAGAQGDGTFANVEMPTDEEGRTVRSGYQQIVAARSMLVSSCAVGGSAFGVASIGPDPSGGVLSGNATRVNGTQGPLADFPSYQLFYHRRGSPIGSGWAVQEAKTAYRTPDRMSGDIVDGEGGRETFRPYPQVKLVTSALTSQTALATDAQTGEVFVATVSDGVQAVNLDTGALTPVASGARYGGNHALLLKVTHVGAERRFLVATRAALFEINSAGVQRNLYSFSDIIDSSIRFAGVAGVGKYAYFTEDKRAKTLNEAVDAVLLRRIDLTAASPIAEAITAATGGDLRLDPHGETSATGFQFQHPRGLAASFDGGLYVADDRRHAVYYLAPDATGQVGPSSVVTRVLGSGVDTMIPGLGESAPALEFALRAPGELAAAPDGTLYVTTANWSNTYASLVAFDPVSKVAHTVALDKTSRLKQIELAVQQGSLAPLDGNNVLIPYASAAYRLSTSLSSQFDPTRTLTFDAQGATVTDITRDTVEQYTWLNAAATEARLTAAKQRSGELIYGISYLDDDRIDYLADATGGRTHLVYDAHQRLSEIVDDAGRTTQITVDDEGDLREIVFPDGEARRFTYVDHRLVSAVHPDGQTAEYTYSPDGTFLSAKRPGGGVTTMHPALPAGPKYDANGRLYYETKLTDARGVDHTYEMNIAGAVVSDKYTADGIAYTAQNVYADKLVGVDSFETIPNRLLRVSSTTVNGLLVTPVATFDPMGRAVISVQGPTYPSNNEIGRVTFNNQGRLAVQDFAPTFVDWTYSYDVAGHRIKMADKVAGGAETGRATLFSGFRPDDGQPSSVTQHGVTTTFTYDDRGRVKLAQNTIGESVGTTYDAAGNPLHVDDGITTLDYTYDQAGRVTSATDAEGHSTTLEYQGAGCACSNGLRVRKLVTPDLTGDQAWTFDYDADGHLTTTHDPLGGSAQFTFNAQRDLVATVDRGGRSTTYSHDQVGRVSSVIDLGGRLGSFTYALPTAGGWQGATLYAQSPNANPAPISLTAALADGQYQVGTNAMAVGGDQSHAELYRDATFQLAFWHQMDALGRETFRADRTGMPIDSTQPGPYSAQSGSVPFVSEQTGYDSYGSPFSLPSLLETTDKYTPNRYYDATFTRNANYDIIEMPGFLGTTEAVRTTFTRDIAGRVTRAETTYDGSATVQATPIAPERPYRAPLPSVITYASNGLPTFTGNALAGQSLTYDARGLLASRDLAFSSAFCATETNPIQRCDAGVFQYAYDSVGRNTTLTYPEGFTREQQFDALGRLTSRCYNYDTGQRCYTATYDAVGNPKVLTDPEMRREIEYDSLDRVIEVRRYVPAAATTPAYVEHYAYNALGGFTTYDNAPVDDQRPRLGGAGTAAAGVRKNLAGTPVDMDAGGRVTQLEGVKVHYFGLDNRAQSITQSSGFEDRLSYDGLGRCVGHDSYPPGASQRQSAEIYLYDGTGDNITNFDVTFRDSGDGREYGGPEPSRAVVYEGIDTPLWFTDIRTTYYYELDTLGNVRRLHRSQDVAAGLIRKSRDTGGYAYTAFGRTLDPTEPGGVRAPDDGAGHPIFQALHWQGRPSIAGLYYFRARLWSPELGTFLQPDRYGFLTRGGTLWSWPGNSPFRWRDPSGRFPLDGTSDPWNGTAEEWADPGYREGFGQGVGYGLAGAPVLLAAMFGGELELGAAALLDGIAQSVRPAAMMIAAVAGGATKCEAEAPELESVAPEAASVAGEGKHIVLGMRDYGTRELANRLGATHLLDEEAWMEGVKAAARDPNTRITVNLSGFSGETPYSQVMGAAARGMTPYAKYTEWEVAQLYQAGRLATVNFVNSAGESIPNPFQ